MKTLITVLALATTVIANAAHSAPNGQTRKPLMTEQSSDEVTFNGRRGQDPDPYVRHQILRDFQSFH
jgi:hypothetical protein